MDHSHIYNNNSQNMFFSDITGVFWLSELPQYCINALSTAGNKYNREIDTTSSRGPTVIAARGSLVAERSRDALCQMWGKVAFEKTNDLEVYSRSPNIYPLFECLYVYETIICVMWFSGSERYVHAFTCRLQLQSSGNWLVCKRNQVAYSVSWTGSEITQTTSANLYRCGKGVRQSFGVPSRVEGQSFGKESKETVPRKICELYYIC